MQTLTRMLASAVAAHPDRPFFVTSGTTLSYAEFDERASRLAAVLAGRHVAKGEPVGVLLPSTLELALTYWVVQKLGAVAVPLNPMSRAPEIARAASLTRLRVLITDPSGGDEIRHLEQPPEDVLVWEGVVDRTPAGLESLLATAPGGVEDVACGPDDPVCMFFTSGTTGQPKAVIQDQRGHQSALTAMFVHNRLRFGREVVLNVLPLFNNFGASGVMNTSVFAGATMVHLERWNAAQAVELITRHRVTFMLGSPTMYVDLCEQYDPARHDLSHIRTAVTAGSAAPVALVERFLEITGVRLTQLYGATETTAVVTGEPHTGRPRPGSIGKLVGGAEIQILDDDGRPVPTGEPGELVISGAVVSPGYFEDPEAQRAHTAHGWRSGDIGYVDEDGYYYLVDRKKDVVICGGNNIYPAEVEAVIAEHPQVATCAVVGIPHARLGEVRVAVVVFRPGEAVGAESIIGHCRERIAAYKVPRQVRTAVSLPLGPTGKVLKTLLRDQVLGATAAEGVSR
jgi:long-chain acyl-CoA synthetase